MRHPSGGMREGRTGQLYEGLLELPVLVVLLTVWLVGWGLLGLCALAFYLLWGVL